MKKLLAALPVLSLLVACAGNTEEAGDGANSAIRATTDDLIAACAPLEEQDLSATALGDASIRVKQEYSLYDGTKVTNTADATTVYDVRFYRDGAGKTKFQLSIGAFAGIQSSIEGATKALTVSGTVEYDGENSGKLVITSRRDAFKAVAGDVTSFAFRGLDCDDVSSSFQIDMPLIVFEKANEKLVPVTTGRGEEQVSPSIRFKKKADRTTMRMGHSLG